MTKEISWQALEFTEYKKHPLWFLAAALLAGALILYGIYSRSWSTVGAFVMFGILGIIYSMQKPATVTIKLDGQGVHVNTLLYPFQNVKKFWIVYHPPEVKALYLETTGLIDRVVKLELGNQDPLAVKEFLKQFAHEDLEAEESLIDVIARRIKF